MIQRKDAADAEDFPAAVFETAGVDHIIESGHDLIPDGIERQIETGIHDAGFQTEQAVVRIVGVNGGHGTGMAGVHGLEQIQSLIGQLAELLSSQTNTVDEIALKMGQMA